MQAHGHALDVLRQVHVPQHLLHLFHGGARGHDGDVFVDSAGDELAVLQHYAELLAQLPLVQAVQVTAVVVDPAVLGLLEAQQQLEQGGLPAAGGPHDAHVLPGPDAERDPFEHVLLRIPVGELQVAHLDLPGEGARHHPGGPALLLPFREGVQQQLPPPVQGRRGGELQQGIPQGQKGRRGCAEGRGEAHEGADTQLVPGAGRHQGEPQQEQPLGRAGDGLGRYGEALLFLPQGLGAGVGLQVLAHRAVLHPGDADFRDAGDELVQDGAPGGVLLHDAGLIAELPQPSRAMASSTGRSIPAADQVRPGENRAMAAK